MVARGEIWWYEPPDEKRRPYLILTRTAGIPVLTSLVAAPATTTRRYIASEVNLGPEDGMPAECALSLDNVSTISKAHLTKRVAVLSDEKLRATCSALQFVVEC